MQFHCFLTISKMKRNTWGRKQLFKLTFSKQIYEYMHYPESGNNSDNVLQSDDYQLFHCSVLKFVNKITSSIDETGRTFPFKFDEY